MSLKLKYLILICVLFQNSIFSQIQFVGKIIDSEKKSPLAYVNIGIINRNVGTVSSENGDFSIFLDNIYNNDSLRFSIIGYKSKTYKIADLIKKQDDRIFLEKENYEIDEIVVIPRKYKTKILGNETQSQVMQAGFSNNELGNEVGVKIKIKGVPTFIESFNFYISQNKYDSLFFRLNIYSIKNGLPFENLLKENIFLSTQVEYGAVSFDLKKYNIVVEEDFIISLEWIKNLGENGLYFSASFANAPIYTRVTSQGEWEKVSIIGLGFNVSTKYCK